MRTDRQPAWDRIRKLAFGLGLPGVEETTSYGQPALKAHGKLWVWWSPHADAPVFKVPAQERDVLVEAEPGRFFVPDHYRGSDLVLVRPEQLDPGWIEANLRRVWRDLAPRRARKALDEATPPSSAARRSRKPA